MFDLAGEVALVTGGAKGIGKGIAKALKQARAKVIIGDVDKKNGKMTANELVGIFVILMLQIKIKCSMLFKAFVKNMGN